MATSAKNKKNTQKQTRVTRITASDSEAKSKKRAKTTAKTTATAAKTETKAKKENQTTSTSRNPFSALAGYFRGSWQEIKQVRWPDRPTTWGLVGALIVFTAALFIVIILIDYGFAWLFKLLMGTN